MSALDGDWPLAMRLVVRMDDGGERSLRPSAVVQAPGRATMRWSTPPRCSVIDIRGPLAGPGLLCEVGGIGEYFLHRGQYELTLTP